MTLDEYVDAKYKVKELSKYRLKNNFDSIRPDTYIEAVMLRDKLVVCKAEAIRTKAYYVSLIGSLNTTIKLLARDHKQRIGRI